MQTIQLQIPDDVITEYGRDSLTEQLDDYQKILEQIRQEAWDEY
jgi:cell division septal protein FtsQ